MGAEGIGGLMGVGLALLAHTPILAWSACLAVLLSVRAIQGSPGLTHAARNALNGLAVCVTSLPFALAAGALLHRLSPHPLWQPHGAIPWVGFTLVWLIAMDGLYYAWHRAQHRIGFLWRLHAVHHSDTQLNASSYARQHWSEMPIQTFLIGVPLVAAFGFTTPPALASFFVSAWNFLIHADLEIGRGAVARIVTTPLLHRLHHSRDPHHHDCNFASFFPFWDMIFGTWRAPPARGAHLVTGLDHRVAGWQMRMLEHG
jgi:sterol desaturase/sphingolipid hydroxylase (fatty acid hydroxylase superfamily)